ncbi:MAG: Glyoxylase, beta-lactamase superfamily [Flaviaesturariibacter sp.]|nr:Glyoxylase, beta-lactamase superfamily [Flaviaesturariibacter sp.]
MHGGSLTWLQTIIQNKFKKMKLIAKDVYQIPLMPRNSINAYLVEDVLIDAGIRSSSSTIFRSISGKQVSTHVLTHAHADHQGSSKVICEQLNIPLWCSPPEKPQAENGNVTKEYPKQNHIVTKFQKRFWAGEGYKVSRTLKENDYIGDFAVIETPGHSSGHLSFYREKDGLLIVGDALVNMNLLTTVVGLHEPPSLFTADREVNIKSIKKLASLHPKILCFGHGPVLNNAGKFELFAKSL